MILMILEGFKEIQIDSERFLKDSERFTKILDDFDDSSRFQRDFKEISEKFWMIHKDSESFRIILMILEGFKEILRDSKRFWKIQ